MAVLGAAGGEDRTPHQSCRLEGARGFRIRCWVWRTLGSCVITWAVALGRGACYREGMVRQGCEKPRVQVQVPAGAANDCRYATSQRVYWPV